MPALLTVEDIHTAYGLSRVLFGVSLEIAAGECVCLLGRNGMAKIITLSLAASVALKEFELRTGFHSLRNYPLFETLSDIDHGADNGRIRRIISDLVHKGLVQLQRVHRKPPQIRKTGITCAKIVDCQLHAHSFQRNECIHRRLRVLHQHALGQFQLKIRRTHSRRDQHSPNS